MSHVVDHVWHRDTPTSEEQVLPADKHTLHPKEVDVIIDASMTDLYIQGVS